jgi:CoA:oxalate CoA-transferase
MEQIKQKKGPLEGVRILDLTRALAGPYGSLILGDLGAEVIKIETPQEVAMEFGSRTALDPRYSYGGEDVYFLSINRNKKSLTLNLKVPQAKQVFFDLVKKADVVFDNFRPGVMEKLGIDYESLKKINPRIISCSLTGFGPDGPYEERPAFDLIIQALSGGISITGDPDPNSPPVRAGVAVADLGGGMFSAQGIMAALYSRERTGVGQKVDVSLLDGQISMLGYVAAYWLISGVIQGRLGTRHQNNPVYGALKTKDGYVAICAHRGPFWKNLCRAMKREDLIDDPRCNSDMKRHENSDEIWDLLGKIFATKTTSEWLNLLNESDVPCAPINTVDAALSDPQVLHNNMVVTLKSPGGGEIKLVGNPIKMSGTVQQPYEYPVKLGQNTEEILQSVLGYSKQQIQELRKNQAIG